MTLRSEAVRHRKIRIDHSAPEYFPRLGNLNPAM